MLLISNLRTMLPSGDFCSKAIGSAASNAIKGRDKTMAMTAIKILFIEYVRWMCLTKKDGLDVVERFERLSAGKDLLGSFVEGHLLS